MVNETANLVPKNFQISASAKSQLLRLVEHWKRTEDQVLPAILWLEKQPGVEIAKLGIGAYRTEEAPKEMIFTISGVPIVFAVAEQYRHFFVDKTLEFQDGDFILAD